MWHLHHHYCSCHPSVPYLQLAPVHSLLTQIATMHASMPCLCVRPKSWRSKSHLYVPIPKSGYFGPTSQAIHYIQIIHSSYHSFYNLSNLSLMASDTPQPISHSSNIPKLMDILVPLYILILLYVLVGYRGRNVRPPFLERAKCNRSDNQSWWYSFDLYCIACARSGDGRIRIEN